MAISFSESTWFLAHPSVLSQTVGADMVSRIGTVRWLGCTGRFMTSERPITGLARRLDHCKEVPGADCVGEGVPGGRAHPAVLLDLGAGEMNGVDQGTEGVVEVIGLGDRDA